MIAAFILASLLLVAGCIVLHLVLWSIAAYADHHRVSQRREATLDIRSTP